MEILSDRVLIRETVFEDLSLFDKWEKKEYVKEFLSIDEGRELKDVISDYYLRLKDETCIDFTLVDRQNNNPFGRLFLSRIDNHVDSCDITRIYIGEESYLGKGYAKEALKALLEFLFEELKMNRVTLDFFDGNNKASKLYESIGFVHEGKMRESTKKNNTYYNLNLMSIIRSEYKK